MVPQGKKGASIFILFFWLRLRLLRRGSESTYLSKVWKIPQSLNLNIIFWHVTYTLLFISAIVKKIKIQKFETLKTNFIMPTTAPKTNFFHHFFLHTIILIILVNKTPPCTLLKDLFQKTSKTYILNWIKSHCLRSKCSWVKP